MQKRLFFFTFVFLFCTAQAQIRLSKLIGDQSSNYTLGYGAYLKLSHPVSEADALSLEVGVDYFSHKTNSSKDCGVLPLKLGYRYTLNRSGTGFYVEPQAGYNFIGSDQNGKEFKGIAVTAGGGYLFEPWGKIQFDLSLRYSANFYAGGTLGLFIIWHRP